MKDTFQKFLFFEENKRFPTQIYQQTLKNQKEKGKKKGKKKE